MPGNLVAEPQTSKDVLHNAVTWEFWGYDWQDYAFALEEYVRNIKVTVTPPP